jgi:large subunit ribosomal protein L10e
VTSRNWGFTPYSRDDFVQWRKEGRLVNSGVHATVRAARRRRPASALGLGFLGRWRAPCAHRKL